MKTDPRTAAVTAAPLIPVRDFPTVARNAHIRESDRTLIASGRLIRLTIGRRNFYRLAEVLEAAPGPAYPLIAADRPGLTGHAHTITVERIDPSTARAQIPYRMPDELLGTLAVVERHHGHLRKVCVTESELWDVDAETAARSYAGGYGARYIPAGGE